MIKDKIRLSLADGGKLSAVNVKKASKKYTYSLLRAFFLISVGYIVLYPLLYMLASAFKAPSDAMDPSVVWVPRHFSLENIGVAFKYMEYPRAFFTSLTSLIIPGLVEVFTCALVAYGLARFKFKGKNLIFVLVMLTILVPPQTMVAPLYLQYSHLDFFGILGLIGKIIGHDIRPRIVDSFLTFLLPSLFGAGLRSGLFIFVYRQFFTGLPKELEEAAYVDGANPFYTFIKIILPSSGAAILCITLFSVIWHWNEYDLSTIYMSGNYPLPYMLSNLKSMVIQFASDYSMASVLDIVMAGCVIFLAPVLIFYLIVQKYFIQSIARIGIVG